MAQKETQRHGLITATALLWVWWFVDPRIDPDVDVAYELSLVIPLTATLFLVRDIYLRGWFPKPVPSTHFFKDAAHKKIISAILIGIIIYCIYTIYIYRDHLYWLPE